MRDPRQVAEEADRKIRDYERAAEEAGWFLVVAAVVLVLVLAAVLA